MKILLALALLSTNAFANITLCSAVRVVGPVAAVPLQVGAKTFQGKETTTSGNGTAAVTIEASLDGVWFDSIATLTLTTAASDSVTTNYPAYKVYRCNITAISGTGAAVTVTEAN